MTVPITVWVVQNADGVLLSADAMREIALYNADFGCDDAVQEAFALGESGPYHGFTITEHVAIPREEYDAMRTALRHPPACLVVREQDCRKRRTSSVTM